MRRERRYKFVATIKDAHGEPFTACETRLDARNPTPLLREAKLPAKLGISQMAILLTLVRRWLRTALAVLQTEE